MPRFSEIPVALGMALALAGPALAWGPEGHAIVAEIAEAQLTPAAAAGVQRLLSEDSPPHKHLDEIASWADDYRAHGHLETARWHYVNIPLEAWSYDAARDCPDGDCVVAQIPRWANVLGDASAPVPDRVQALKFVVHLVGDIHQPLHCEENGDRGGNDLRLTFHRRHTNLHAVWDGGIIDDELHVHHLGNFEPDLAATRAFQFTIGVDSPAGMQPSLEATVISWANEAHALAHEAYDRLPARRSHGWEDTYEAAEWRSIEVQLARAGRRLSNLLNDELR